VSEAASNLPRRMLVVTLGLSLLLLICVFLGCRPGRPAAAGARCCAA